VRPTRNTPRSDRGGPLTAWSEHTRPNPPGRSSGLPRVGPPDEVATSRRPSHVGLKSAPYRAHYPQIETLLQWPLPNPTRPVSVYDDRPHGAQV
jgi:hypothetical protein